MALRRASAALLLGVLVSVPVATQMKVGSPAGDFVELDVAVVDRKGSPVHGLTASDFRVEDEGRRVEVATFTEMRGPDPGDPDSARTIVLLLDDTGVSPTGTQTVQIIARAFLDFAEKHDDLSVVRLHGKDDEPYGDRIAAEGRIRDYRGGAWPFAYWSTAGEVLDRVASLSRSVAVNVARRKVIVCVGAPGICNLNESITSAPISFERSWNAAVREAAAANVSVYAFVPGRAPLRGGGLAEMTGGEVFATSYDVGPPVERILRDASNYYVLGYWPVRESKGLHRVQVKTTVKGARALARRLR